MSFILNDSGVTRKFPKTSDPVRIDGVGRNVQYQVQRQAQRGGKWGVGALNPSDLPLWAFPGDWVKATKFTVDYEGPALSVFLCSALVPIVGKRFVSDVNKDWETGGGIMNIRYAVGVAIGLLPETRAKTKRTVTVSATTTAVLDDHKTLILPSVQVPLANEYETIGNPGHPAQEVHVGDGDKLDMWAWLVRANGLAGVNPNNPADEPNQYVGSTLINWCRHPNNWLLSEPKTDSEVVLLLSQEASSLETYWIRP